MKKNAYRILLFTALLNFSVLAALGQDGQGKVENPFSGRVQFIAEPGLGPHNLTSVGDRLPVDEVYVGVNKNGGGLAFLVGIDVSDQARSVLYSAKKAEFVVNVVGHNPFNGAPASPQVVALLTAGISKDEKYPNRRAWGRAEDFRVLGNIPASPANGEYRFDITEALAQSPQVSTEKSLIYFAIYSPGKDLNEQNIGKQVLYSGSGNTAPRIDIGD